MKHRKDTPIVNKQKLLLDQEGKSEKKNFNRKVNKINMILYWLEALLPTSLLSPQLLQLPFLTSIHVEDHIILPLTYSSF